MQRIILSAIILLANSPARAVPQALNFQGRLLEHGVPVSGSREMSFKIYGSPTGGSPLYTEHRPAVAVSTGIFTVTIGDVTPVPVSVFDGNERYIEVNIGGAALPRQRMVSVGHAFVAGKAQTLAEGAAIKLASATVSGDMKVTGTLSVGEGTVHLAAAAGGVTNGITFTQIGAQPFPQIRTAATGSQGAAGPTGALPLSINAGASGLLSLNPLSSGNVLISENALSNLGIGTNAPASKLHVAVPVGVTGNVVTATVGGTEVFSILGTGEVRGTRFVGDGSLLTGVVAGTAGALAANGADCAAGNAPIGVDAAGAAEGCFDVGTQAEVDAKVSKAGDTMTGPLTLTGPTGTLTATALSGNGSALTALTAANITAGGTASISVTGSAAALAANGANCAAGNAPLGIDAAGGAEGCYDVGTQAEVDAKVSKAGDTMTGPLTLTGPTGNLTATAVSGDGSGLTNVSAVTAARLSANGANCAAGNAPLGVDTAGAAEGCYDVGTQAEVDAKVSKAGDTMTGPLTLTGPTGNLTATAVSGDGSGLTNVSAASLSANGANCAAGNAALGVNAVGAAEGCFDVGTQAEVDGKVSRTGDTMTGPLTLTGPTGTLTATALSGNGAGLTALTPGNISAGTAGINVSGTAAALAANGANCAAGSAAVGVNAAGAAEGCFDVGTQTEVDGKVSKTGDTMTGPLTLTGPTGTLTATALSGNGAGLTALAPANISAGTAGINVAGTAAALAANGANCAAGSAPLGVDATGAAEGCFDVGTQAELEDKVSTTGDTMTGPLTLTGPTGNLTATNLAGNGSALTALTAANITAGGTASISVTGTAAALAANGANCAAGTSPLGVDTAGAAEGCFDVGTQAEVDAKVSKAGDTMTGPLTLSGPTGKLTATALAGNGAELTDLDGAKITAGTIADGRLPGTMTGKTFTGPVVATTFSGDGSGLTRAAVPNQPNQLVNKAYVDAAIGGSGGGYSNLAAFKTAGSASWTVPAGVTKIMIEVWGAGGGGGPATFSGNAWFGGQGGGGGGYGKGVYPVTPGSVLTVVVGDGGRPGDFNSFPASWSPGTAGQASRVLSGSTELASATGGGGGANGLQPAGQGGDSTAPFSVKGQKGRIPNAVGSSQTVPGGDGGDVYQHDYAGGDGGTVNGSPSGDGVAPGGGAGGMASGTGSNAGRGAPGAVLIWY